MKVGFGPALPVGTAGLNEYYDVWLKRYTSARTVFGLLMDATPADLAPCAAGYIAEAEPSLTAALTIARYVVLITGEESKADRVRTALASLVESGTLAVEHKGKVKVFDLARGLPEEARVSESAEGSAVELTIRIGPEGSLRPDVLMRAALEAAELSAAVAHVTRTDVLIETEGGVWTRPL